nr:unnamed protein product [Callosobruchus chinensis]
MDLDTAVVLWRAYRQWKLRKRRERRRFNVHPILRDRMTHSMFITLYPKLREHSEKFFNYFRMSVTSFDDLLNIIQEDLAPCQNYVARDTVSAEEKLVITLSVLLAVCDANYCFIAVDIGAYGKSNDSTIFKESVFYKKLVEKTLDIPEPRPISQTDITPLPHVIVGDEAFSLSENIMRPYCGKSLTTKKRILNYRLSRARRYIECCFGILANKWRIFHRPLNVDIEFTENLIKACCVLHNYVRLRDGYRYDHTLYITSLTSLNTETVRPNARSLNTRDRFAHYFVNEGKLPWQDKLI